MSITGIRKNPEEKALRNLNPPKQQQQQQQQTNKQNKNVYDIIRQR